MSHPRADAIASLPPAAFGFVMATGILAVAAHQQELPALALALFCVAVLGWVVLWALTGLRLLQHPARMLADLRDHVRGPGFFTAVAGTAVLARGCIALQVSLGGAMVLGALALLLWVGITYALFLLLITQAQKPALQESMGGSWLLAVVACQSVSLVAGLLSPHFDQPVRLQLNFLALVLWLAGGALYTWMAALLFYRYLFLRFQPADLTPPSWINMGAMAISTLAGTQLVGNAPDAPLLHTLLPFVQGFTLLYWATGSWWLPLLLGLVAWRYLWKRDAPGTGLDWSAVFPLGMYSAATHQLALELPLGFLQGLARVFFWLALLAWAATAVARLRRFGAGLVRHAPAGPAR